MSNGIEIGTNRKLRFSVIVPTFNRPARLAACVKSLESMDYPHERFEVIVVNDGGASVDSCVDQEPGRRFRMVLEDQIHRGPAAARNRGAALSTGTFLVFLDDDCTAAPSCLKKLDETFQNRPEALVGGRTVNADVENPFAEASQTLVDFLYSHFVRFRPCLRFFTSNNLSVSRNLFFRMSGFDERFPGAAGEDRDFCSRWIESGLPIISCQDALVFHRHDLSLGSFVRQHFHYGRGARIYHRLRMRRTGLQVRPEPPSFYASMLRYPFLRNQRRRPWMVSILIGLSQAANAAGFFFGNTTDRHS